MSKQTEQACIHVISIGILVLVEPTQTDDSQTTDDSQRDACGGYVRFVVNCCRLVDAAISSWLSSGHKLTSTDEKVFASPVHVYLSYTTTTAQIS